MEDGMLFQLGEDGTLSAYEEPYCSVDFNKFNEILKKHTPKKPINQATWKACPTCEQGLGITKETPNPRATKYCYHCGQKLDWD